MDKNNGKLDKLRIFSGAQLKYIAFLSMLADHVNKALIYPFLSGEGILQRISDAFDILGRIAFPLFAFFLVEGFFKTGNRKKYLASLLIFGIISEIPFDMALSGVFFELNSNNIMFTLALMLITIWTIDILKEKMQNMSKYTWYPVFKEVWSLLGFSLILTYNGKRGKQNKLFNYCFYPVHLLILGILRIYLKI